VAEDLDELEDRRSEPVTGRPAVPIEPFRLRSREEALGDNETNAPRGPKPSMRSGAKYGRSARAPNEDVDVA
jgi:hypothetical protein